MHYDTEKSNGIQKKYARFIHLSGKKAVSGWNDTAHYPLCQLSSPPNSPRRSDEELHVRRPGRRRRPLLRKGGSRQRRQHARETSSRQTRGCRIRSLDEADRSARRFRRIGGGRQGASRFRTHSRTAPRHATAQHRGNPADLSARHSDGNPGRSVSGLQV